jgi:hypothetical protein
MRFACSFLSTIAVVGSASGFASQAMAVSLQVHGQAGIIGDYMTGLPPSGAVYQGIRVPLGFTLEARPTNNLAAFLDLRLASNQFPTPARSLGNSQGIASSPTLPFSRNDWSHWNNTDQVYANFAFVEYASSDFGLFRVGRIPRHWGLGIWRNDAGVAPSPHYREWIAEAGSVSTTDGVSVNLDFRNINVGAHWEKNAEGDALTRSDDAESWTVDMMVGDSLTEAGQSTFGREIGIAFSRFTASRSSTRMNILDIYSRLRYGALGFEGEFLYPNGSTESAQYEGMGGAGTCATDAAKAAKDLMCTSARVDWVSALFKARYQFSTGGVESTMSTSEAVARRGVPSASRRESHSAGLWLGFASGDKDALVSGNDNVNMGVMHPNVKPSLLMFNGLGNESAGMPGAMVGNAIFLRGEYTFESPTSGTIIPSVVWGRLRETRSADVGKTLADTNGVGRYADLGTEFQVSYSYVTEDFLKLGGEFSVLMPGSAWATKGSTAPDYAVGGRLLVSTVFH